MRFTLHIAKYRIHWVFFWLSHTTQTTFTTPPKWAAQLAFTVQWKNSNCRLISCFVAFLLRKQTTAADCGFFEHCPTIAMCTMFMCTRYVRDMDFVQWDLFCSRKQLISVYLNRVESKIVGPCLQSMYDALNIAWASFCFRKDQIVQWHLVLQFRVCTHYSCAAGVIILGPPPTTSFFLRSQCKNEFNQWPIFTNQSEFLQLSWFNEMERIFLNVEQFSAFKAKTLESADSIHFVRVLAWFA